VKEDLVKNISEEWVSKVKSEDGKKNNRLEKHGYFTQKGKFGSKKMANSRSKKRMGKQTTRSLLSR